MLLSFDYGALTLNTLNTLQKQLSVAPEFGINSVKQLLLFAAIAEHEGQDLYGILGLPPDNQQAINTRAVLTKLMRGEPSRPASGLQLIEYGEMTIGKSRALLLTAKGRRLAAKLSAL